MDDYKERFRKEYFELCERRRKLGKYMHDWELNKLEESPRAEEWELFQIQKSAMDTYLYALIARAQKEDIDISMTAGEG